MKTPRLHGVGALALAGISVLLIASCGAREDGVRAPGGTTAVGPASASQPAIRSLVIQVAGMKKSQGGST